MTKYRLISLIDKIFISASIFLLIFAWINFFILDLTITFILSLIFSFACVFLLFYFLDKKQNKKTASKNFIQETNKHFLNFKISTLKEKQNLLKTLLSFNNKVEEFEEFLTYNNNNNKFLVVFFTLHKLSENDFFNILSKINTDYDVLQIICESCENFNKDILINKSVEFIDKTTLYKDYFLKYNIFPEEKIIKTTSKIKFKDFIKNFFSYEKSKGFFISGLILIFSSIILPFHTYYIIFGSILLVFAIICKLHKTQ